MLEHRGVKTTLLVGDLESLRPLMERQTAAGAFVVWEPDVSRALRWLRARSFDRIVVGSLPPGEAQALDRLLAAA